MSDGGEARTASDPSPRARRLVAVAARLAAADRLAPPADESALVPIADAAVVAVGVTAASIALHDAAAAASCSGPPPAPRVAASSA